MFPKVPYLPLFLWFFLSTKLSFPFNYFPTHKLLVEITKLIGKNNNNN